MKAPLQEDVDSKKEAERAVCNCAVRRPDIHGLDIDGEFRNPKSSRPKNWEVSLKAANEILIDEMRTLLELHYDDINSAKQAQRSPKDKKGSVLACAAFAHNVPVVLEPYSTCGCKSCTASASGEEAQRRQIRAPPP